MVERADPTPSRAGSSKRYGEILDVAAHIFYDKGYEVASIQDVADAVGILKGSLYYYIDSKQDLLYDIIESVHEDIVRSIERWQLAEGDALAKLRTVVEGHLLANIGNQVRVGVFYHDFRSLDPDRRARIVRARDTYDTFLRKLISDGQREGTIDPDLDPKMAVLAILGMINWVNQWWRDDGPRTAQEVAAEFADLILSGVMRHPDEPHRSTLGKENGAAEPTARAHVSAAAEASGVEA